jgi:hypothetical protein
MQLHQEPPHRSGDFVSEACVDGEQHAQPAAEFLRQRASRLKKPDRNWARMGDAHRDGPEREALQEVVPPRAHHDERRGFQRGFVQDRFGGEAEAHGCFGLESGSLQSGPRAFDDGLPARSQCGLAQAGASWTLRTKMAIAARSPP